MENDRAPAVAGGSWVFALACGAFLAALIVAGVAMPSEGEIISGAYVPPGVSAGRSIFNGEGCAECHSGLVRSQDRGLGPVAGSNMLIDETRMPGSSRLGPDLQNIAGRYPASLLETRLREPGALQPKTLMPSYDHLDDTEIASLIAYLEKPLAVVSRWEAVRARNEIESAIPDELLVRLQDYIDFETGLFMAPIQGTPEERIIGRGLYNSRCAACHGLSGRGDGPASWEDWRPGPSRASRADSPVPPADFAKDEFEEYSFVLWYWRITEGIPGTSMPAWGGSLSEDAVWLLVGYVRVLGAEEISGAPESDDGDVPVYGDPIEGSEETSTILNIWPEGLEEELGSGSNESISQSADGASEEEGERDESGGDLSDVTESAESILTEEDTL